MQLEIEDVFILGRHLGHLSHVLRACLVPQFRNEQYNFRPLLNVGRLAVKAQRRILGQHFRSEFFYFLVDFLDSSGILAYCLTTLSGKSGKQYEDYQSYLPSDYASIEFGAFYSQWLSDLLIAVALLHI